MSPDESTPPAPEAPPPPIPAEPAPKREAPATAPPRRGSLADSEAQRVFDTVTGPNLRISDNLIQLGVIIAGTILGVILGAVWVKTQNGDLATGMVAGGFFGLVLALLLSGFMIGVIRGILAAQKR